MTTGIQPLRRCLSESYGQVKRQKERARNKSLYFEATPIRTTKKKSENISTDLLLYLILTLVSVLKNNKELRKYKLCDFNEIYKKKCHRKSKDQEAPTNTLRTQMNDCLNEFNWFESKRTLATTKVSLQKLFPFLFEDFLNCLSSVQRTIIKAFPLIDCSSTLEEYVQKELNSTQSINPLNSSPPEKNLHSLNMEIIRISSFSNFPQTSTVSTIRLAKEGFYYTGEGNKVACFACGFHRDGLKAGDDLREIHRRLSPNCPFLISFQSGNVPVRERENVASNHADNQARENSGTTLEHINQTGERNLLQNSTLSMSNNEMRQRENTRAPVPTITSSNSTQEGYNLNVTSSERPERERPHQRSRALQEKINDYLRNLDPLGINFDRPKYPAYAVIATRVSSFNDWPSNITQTPRDLALAGFLYAGYGDYTRCFFCGGGVRNWEPGGDPWTEHARWFPKCAFLRQNKGDEFIALVQIEHNEMESSEAMNAGEGAASNTCRNDIRLTETEEKNPEDNTTASYIFNLVSVQSVLEMGYTRQTVKEAFDLLRITKHVNDISGEDLIDAILLKEESSTRSDIQPATHIPNKPKVQERNNAGYSTETNKTENKPSIDSYSDTKSLIEENRRLKDLRLCKICLENEASIAMLPCGHLCCCPDCAPAMRKCPICRQFVKGTVKTWLV